mgnify:CR=1 FL=1
MKKYIYKMCCIHSCYRLINDMKEKSIEITANTFFKYVSLKFVNEMLDYTLNGKSLNSIKKDYYVTYHRSEYKGSKCYYLFHSGIEYIFI